MQVNTLSHLNNKELFRGARVFLRLDLNVPLKNGEVADATRIEAAIPTLKFLIESGCKLVVTSHLGRPKGRIVPEMSLEPVGSKLAEYLGSEVVFVKDMMQEPIAYMLDRLNPGQILLLENLRFHPGETENSRSFAEHFSEGIDFFVNDAFGTLHRAHASTVGIPDIIGRDRCTAGFLVEKEIKALSPLLKQVPSPFTVIMGGAKVSDKIGVAMNMMEHCNHLIIGGAMAYSFLHVKGVAVGDSKIEQDKLSLVDQILEVADKRRVQIHLPQDHVVASSFKADADTKVCSQDIAAGWMGLDIGPETVRHFSSIISQSKVVLWNGPMGVFEWEPFAQGTMGVAQAIAACSGQTIVGGGDSVAALNKSGLQNEVTHVSTGGGASLEFLEGKVLPGIQVLLPR